MNDIDATVEVTVEDVLNFLEGGNILAIEEAFDVAQGSIVDSKTEAYVLVFKIVP